MTSAEIMDYLVRTLTGNNAAEFSRRTGIPTTTIAQIRSGKVTIRKQINKIISAFPQVSSEFLMTGEGYPGDLTPEIILDRYKRKIADLENEKKILLKEIELQQVLLQQLTDISQ